MGEALIFENSICDVPGVVGLVTVIGTGVESDVGVENEEWFFLATRLAGGRVVGDVEAVGLITGMGTGAEAKADERGAERSITPDTGLFAKEEVSAVGRAIVMGT